MNDYKKMWNYLKEAQEHIGNWNLYTIMCQIENDTIIIECPECNGNNIAICDSTYYCDSCGWYEKMKV